MKKKRSGEKDIDTEKELYIIVTKVAKLLFLHMEKTDLCKQMEVRGTKLEYILDERSERKSKWQKDDEEIRKRTKIIQYLEDQLRRIDEEIKELKLEIEARLRM